MDSYEDKKSKKGLIIGLILLILFGIGVGTYFVLDGMEKDEPVEKEPEAPRDKESSRVITSSDGNEYTFNLVLKGDFSAANYEIVNSDDLVVYKFDVNPGVVLGGDDRPLTNADKEQIAAGLALNRFEIAIYDIPTSHDNIDYIAVEFGFPFAFGGADKRVYQIIAIKDGAAHEIVDIGIPTWKEWNVERIGNIIAEDTVSFFMATLCANYFLGLNVDDSDFEIHNSTLDDDENGIEFYYLKLTLTGEVTGNKFILEDVEPPHTEVTFSGECY
jgi:hypothetical protein